MDTQSTKVKLAPSLPFYTVNIIGMMDNNANERSRCDLMPALENTLEAFLPLPLNAVYIGKANYDGLPLLLNVNDPSIGGILISGDKSAGKSSFLKVLGLGISCSHIPQNIQFAVISSEPQDWDELAKYPHCVGIFSPNTHRCETLINALEKWMNIPDRTQIIFLLIDTMESIQAMSESFQAKLQKIILDGSHHKIFSVATTAFTNFNFAGKNNILPNFGIHIMCLPSEKDSIYQCRYLVKQDNKEGWVMFSLFAT